MLYLFFFHTFFNEKKKIEEEEERQDGVDSNYISNLFLLLTDDH